MAGSTRAGGLVLGIDTATDDVAVAVAGGERPLAERRVPRPQSGHPRHATALLGGVEAAVAAAGGWEAIGLIAAGVGPGSFTGLRIGIATARALAQGLDRPIAAVGSLAALARGIAADAGRPRLAALDARRGEAFLAIYGGDGTELLAPLLARPDEIARRVAALGEAPLCAGSGSLRFRPELEAAGAEVLPEGDERHRISARHVCALAGRAVPVRPEAIEPIYLRRPDAELWRERDRGTRTDA